MRVALIALASLALGIGIAPEARATMPSARASVVEKDGQIQVGDTLQATRDVSLDEAIIAEGSKVSVSAKHSSSAGVVLDVALADGHVVKSVPLVEIRKSFRRVPG